MHWERFTEQAMKVLLRAKELAVKEGTAQIGAEHFLLALLQEGETLAAQVMTELGADLQVLQEQLSQPSSTEVVPAEREPIPSPVLQRVLHRAVREAELLRDEHVDTTHLLLGLLRERAAAAAKLLFRHGIRYEKVRRCVQRRKLLDWGEEVLAVLVDEGVVDVTEKVLSGEVQLVRCWLAEREKVKRQLVQKERLTPLLLGHPETVSLLVEQLAYDLQFGTVPEELSGRHILAIDWAQIQWQQDAEEALRNLLTKIQQVEPSPVLFVGDLAELRERSPLLWEVVRGKTFLCLASAVPQWWQEFPQQLPSVAFSFAPILVSEPTEEEVWEWLTAHRSSYEEFHRVRVTDDALVTVFRLAHLPQKSVPQRPLLAAARSLLDEACAYVRCQVLTPTELLSLEEEMEQLQVEMRRLLRTGEREQLSVLMERAILLQSRIEAMRSELQAAIPIVTPEVVTQITRV